MANKTMKEMCELIAQYLLESKNIEMSWRAISRLDANSELGTPFSLYAEAEKYFANKQMGA